MPELTGWINGGWMNGWHRGVDLGSRVELVENDRPAWLLAAGGVCPGGSVTGWLPASPAEILDTGIAMFAALVWREAAVVDVATGLGLLPAEPAVQDLGGLDEARKSALFAVCRGLETDRFVRVHVEASSGLRNGLDELRRYRMGSEVWFAGFARSRVEGGVAREQGRPQLPLHGGWRIAPFSPE